MKAIRIAILICLAALCFTACSFIEVSDITLHFYIDGIHFRDMTVNAYTANGIDVGTKDGYTFDGWYSDTTYTTNLNPGKQTTETSLFGRWTKHEEIALYTVTFLSDEGKVLSTQKVAVWSDVREPTPPEKEGFVFNDWEGRPARLTDDCTQTATYKQLFRVDFYDDEDRLLESKIVPAGGLATPPIPPIKASTAEFSYEFRSWVSRDGNYNKVERNMSVYATYDTITNYYPVTLHTENGAEDYAEQYAYGQQLTMPSPEKAADAQYVYTFVGWDTDHDGVADNVPRKQRIYEAFEAWAVYAASVRNYTVTFDVDGTAVDTQVPYMQDATYEGTPVKEEDAQFVYTFAGWDTDRDGVADNGYTQITSDVVAVALFDGALKYYDYFFEDEDGGVYGEKYHMPYGTVIEAPAVVPTKADTTSHTFRFNGWEGYTEGMILSATTHFIARFDCEERLYRITFSDVRTDMSVSYELPYGTVIDYAAEVKPYPYPVEKDPCAYQWLGWYPRYEVTREFTFNLQRSRDYQYVVTWQWGEGDDEVLRAYYQENAILALPATPEKEGMMFAGWDGYVVNSTVNGNATYAARWEPLSSDPPAQPDGGDNGAPTEDEGPSDSPTPSEDE